MMKRVGFCGFKPLDMKMPFCLGFGGVDANGGCSDCDKCDSSNLDFATQRCSRHESFTKNSDKDNLLNTLRRKWRRTKHFKCRKKSESLLNMCHSYPENCESLHCHCSKHHRLKTHKAKTSVGPTSAQVSEWQSCDEFKFVIAESSQGSISDEHKENTNSSCLQSSCRKNCERVLAKVVKLKGCTSQSLSDLSSATNISSPAPKTDSENNICQINNNCEEVVNGATYSNKLCVDSMENVNSSINEDVSNNPGHKLGNLTQELYKLSKYGWYWGPISKSEAESKLIDQPDGAFLVRDSSDDRYILSLSFRSKGKTLHTRIEHSNGLFSFYSQPEPEGGGSTSIIELIKQSMCYSQSGVFCYSRSHSPGSQSFPVRLTKPISRFTHVRSLQYLCRFIIRQHTRFDHIQELPLPSRIKGYLEEGHY